MNREEKQRYDREYHANRTPEAKLEKQKKQYERRIRIRKQLFSYLREHPCVDCGEADPIVLEFDHVRDKKESVITEMMRRGQSFERVLIEVAKCEVRCANCHRRKTAKDFGWYKGVI